MLSLDTILKIDKLRTKHAKNPRKFADDVTKLIQTTNPDLTQKVTQLFKEGDQTTTAMHTRLRLWHQQTTQSVIMTQAQKDPKQFILGFLSGSALGAFAALILNRNTRKWIIENQKLNHKLKEFEQNDKKLARGLQLFTYITVAMLVIEHLVLYQNNIS